ncbi:MAG: cyclase family protein [Bacteroidetes bacterium]|nr:cyclase family protein [Bacteroidota bacterium]
MESTIKYKNDTYKFDLSQPLDISMSLSNTDANVKAWYVGNPKFEPVVMGNWVGDVNQGGSVNFKNLFINPHGHGTHTECVGHISTENYTINKCLTNYFFIAQLISVEPIEVGKDKVIVKKQIEQIINRSVQPEALVIRTLPNTKEKLTKNYSNTNPPYLHPEVCEFLVECGIKHLLIDLPSVDAEVDGGKLLAHRAFWQYPQNTRVNCTISELIFVPENIPDGIYLLNIQITSIESDASPSKPVLYKLDKVF